MNNNFRRMFAAFIIAILVALFVDVHIVNAAPRPEIVPVVGLTQPRGGLPSTATVLTSDGNIYVIPNPWEDAFTGDLWLVTREDFGNDDPTDDQIMVWDLVGYEVPADVPDVYEWHIWDRNIGEYVLAAYSPY